VKVRLITLFVAVAVLAATASCDRKKVYDKYVSAPLSGWERNDTVNFNVPPVKQGGNYSMSINLRTDNSYPFTAITVVVNRKVLPSGWLRADTLKCKLMDRGGHSLGKGINLYQYSFSLPSHHLDAGDSLHVSVNHNMMREILPGIADVGLTVSQE
jgi:gliding motility-associated lipoprotein GldH